MVQKCIGECKEVSINLDILLLGLCNYKHGSADLSLKYEAPLLPD
jgi:hypothetical protein